MAFFQHSFSEDYKDALEDFNDKFGEVTASLSDGKIEFHVMYLLLGKEYLKDILTETPEISRIIIPDFNMSTLEKLLKVVSSGNVHIENSDEEDSLKSLADILYGISFENYQCDHRKIQAMQNKRVVHSTGTQDDWYCQFCGRFFKSKRNCVNHRQICRKNPRRHDSKFECTKCGYIVKTKAGLDAHIKAKHGQQKLYKCLQKKNAKRSTKTYLV